MLSVSATNLKCCIMRFDIIGCQLHMSLLIASADASNGIGLIIVTLFLCRVLRWEKKEKMSGHVGSGQG